MINKIEGKKANWEQLRKGDTFKLGDCGENETFLMADDGQAVVIYSDDLSQIGSRYGKLAGELRLVDVMIQL
ncbi:hypothetical protein [Orenia marismortui]|uniref:Uncharacterized protein n=1 Tax=Orenia marismortui TaxID=46469 RepID=A0A4R8GSD5_9FIRM|nr:hypothetical protein [Orenia marismortui]TDX44587.1 hypothetical protein C7959_15011 [Orenia marismortui]